MYWQRLVPKNGRSDNEYLREAQIELARRFGVEHRLLPRILKNGWRSPLLTEGQIAQKLLDLGLVDDVEEARREVMFYTGRLGDKLRLGDAEFVRYENPVREEKYRLALPPFS